MQSNIPPITVKNHLECANKIRMAMGRGRMIHSLLHRLSRQTIHNYLDAGYFEVEIVGGGILGVGPPFPHPRLKRSSPDAQESSGRMHRRRLDQWDRST